MTSKYLLLILPIFLIAAGETYPIVEPNPIIEINKKINGDPSALNKKIAIWQEESKNKLENLTPNTGIKLKPAIIDNVWELNTSYKTEFDIPDGKGGILFPKGYIVDPKDYIKLTKDIVVINGNNKNEIEWLIKKELINNRNFKILITDGKIVKIMRKINAPIYFYTKEIHNRWKLRHTPSIIKQEKNRSLYVYEFNINLEKAPHKKAVAKIKD